MSQEPEPSLLEYARFYGLAHDHRKTCPLADLGHTDRLVDPPEDPPDDLPINESNGSLPAEKLFFEKDVVALFAWIGTSLSEEPPMFDENIEFDVHRFRRMKLDLPLLRTDHEWDLIEFGPRIDPDLENEFLPFETVDEEADEGFTWPSKYNGLPDEFFERSKSETLSVSNEALLYLRDSMRGCADDEHLISFDGEALSYRKSTARNPVTPPLLPLSPPFVPFVPSSETGRLEFLSDHSSPARQQILEIDRMLNDEDAIVSSKRKRRPSFQDSDLMSLDISNVEEIYSPLKGLRDPPSSPPIKKRSLQDRKVEVPLTPLACEQPLPDKIKRVTFSEVVLNTIPDLPPLVAKNEGISSDDFDAFFADIIEPIGVQAERSIEQEQLQATDTELRVPIPIMDFSRPKAPQKFLDQDIQAKSSNEYYKKPLSELKRIHLSKHVWPAVGQSERELRWNPFPAQAGRFEPQDTFLDDESTSKLLEQPGCIDSETLTWKPDGLRILDDLTDIDEELDTDEFPEANDTDSLIRRRKLELEEEDAIATAARDSLVLKSRLEDDSSLATKVAALNEQFAYHQGDNEETNNLFTISFSAPNELENFMCIRNGENQKRRLITDGLTGKFPEAPRDESQEMIVAIPSVSTVSNPLATNISFPTPHFSVPSIPRPFVISNLFLRDRKLARRIQTLYPAAELIERDCTLYSSPKQATASKKPPIFQPTGNMANEADMILSPSTGLIWTTLLKIKQQSLPGQTARSAIRECIAQAAPRYEKLLVLISQDIPLDPTNEPTSSAIQDLTTSDHSAIADFTTFCAALHRPTQALFVPGTKSQLADQIVAMMLEHGVTDPPITLLPDETLPELFLRRAGMNAFAAQAILAALRDPDAGTPHAAAELGFARFLDMAVEERVLRFGELMGGSRVLRRVSESLDAGWWEEFG